MNKYKLRLIVILCIQLIITVIHKGMPNTFDETNFYHISNWTFWLGMSWGTFTFVYALRLGCNQCGARQVFRGISIFSLRWPQDNCHKCGAVVE